MKKLVVFILVILVLFWMFKSCGGDPATADLHGIVAEDTVGFVGVDVSATAEFLKTHHKMAKKYDADLGATLHELLPKDFYESMELLDPKLFAAMGKEGAVYGLSVDDEFPFCTVWNGLSPLLKESGILNESLQIGLPDEDDNVFLACDTEEALEKAKANFGKKGVKLAKKRLAGIPYDDCLVYGWVDANAVMGTFGGFLYQLPAGGEMAREIGKEAGSLRFGIRAKGSWKLNVMLVATFDDKDTAKKVLDELKELQKQGIAEIKGQVGKADGIAKDIAGTALDTLKGLKIKRSGSDVRLEVVLNLKSAWKIANKAKKLEEKGGKNAVKKAAGGKAGAISCVSNLKQCGLSFLLYAMDHDGLLPAAAGWQKSVDSAGALKCPACGKEYRYLGDSGINADELANADKCVFVYCEFEHEKGKLQACFADGHVASVDKAQLEAAVKSRAAGSLPVVK